MITKRILIAVVFITVIIMAAVATKIFVDVFALKMIIAIALSLISAVVIFKGLN